MATDTRSPEQTGIVFTPATTPPPGPGTYLVAYSWHHPKSQHGLQPHTRLAPGRLPTCQLAYGSHPWAEDGDPLEWAGPDGEGLNEFMRIEAWAPMPVYQSAVPVLSTGATAALGHGMPAPGGTTIRATFMGSQVNQGFDEGQEYKLQLLEPSQTRLHIYQVRHLGYPFQIVSYCTLAHLLECWAMIYRYEQ